MSKTVIRKRSKQKEIDPKFGVSEWDPAELDVRQTRHGTYESRPPPRGGTWRDQIKEEAYKLRQRQREADSPEFISPHSTTDTMDTDEAQEINKQIMEKIEKEPEGSEYLNIVGEGKYENVEETLDTGATFSTVTEMQAEVEKDQQAYEEIESLEDSHIVSFPKLDKEKEALRRKTQGERVPFETEDLMTSLTKIAEPPPIAFTDPSDFDEVLREGDEYLSKIEEELGNEGRKQVLSRVEKGFAKTVRWEPINFPLQQLMKYHLRLPFPHAPKVLSRNPRMWVDKTPILEHPAVLIAIPEWETKYGTKSYAVDVREGYIYAIRNEDWERLVERAYVATDEPLEIEQITPVEKETLTEEVQTLNSKEKGSLKGEEEENKKIREQQDRLLAERLMEKERKEREIKDRNLAEQLQKKQRLEKDEREKFLTEQLLEKERQEEEEMIRIKEEQEQLDREEQIRLEEEKQLNLTEEQKRLQRKELERLRKEHLKTLEKEKKEKEKGQAQGKAGKPTEEEQKQEKESLLDALHSVVNGSKPSKPKDLGWDYQKDKEAKRVFERKKELQKLREKERKSKRCSECRYPKHPGPCPCKLCGRKGHEFKDCPKLKPPKEVSEQTIEFCIECMVPHPPGRCICKLCKTIGHTATECPWLEEAKATTKPPKTETEDGEPEVLFCLHCRSETHRIEDCAAYKVAQAKRKKVWCEKCKQYGHTMADCLDEKQEQRNREIEREILKRKQQLEEIDRKMHQVKRQAERDIGKPPQDKDTRDYPVGGRRPVTKPRKSDREPEPPPPPREGLPSGPPVGAGGGGEPPEGDDPSEPDDSDSDEDDEEESDDTEATEESGFLYDEEGRKIDIKQFYEAIRKRKKRTAKGEDEIPFKVVRDLEVTGDQKEEKDLQEIQ